MARLNNKPCGVAGEGIMKIHVYIQTNKVGSECEDEIEIDDSEMEGMTETEREKYIEEGDYPLDKVGDAQYIIPDELSACDEWLQFFFKPSDVLGFMRLFGYFDISGHHGGADRSGNPSPGIVLAGFYGTSLKWQQFNAAWNQFLAKHGLLFLHTTKLLVGSGEPYASWDEAKRSTVLMEAIRIIHDKLDYANAQAVMFPDFTNYLRDEPKSVDMLISPVATVSYLMHFAAHEYAQKTSYKDAFKYTFESGESFAEAKVLTDSFAEMANNPQSARLFHVSNNGFGFEPKLGCPPVQAADVLANLTYKEMYRQAYSPDIQSREEYVFIRDNILGAYEATNYDGLDHFWQSYKHLYAP